MQWADDTLEVALRKSYRNVDGSFVGPYTYLGDDYYEIAKPVIRDQIAATAIRLAYTLNLALS